MNVNRRSMWIITWAVVATFVTSDIVTAIKVASEFTAAAVIVAGLLLGVGAILAFDR